MNKCFLVVIMALAPFSVFAFELSIPVACNYGTDCFIQNYMDHDKGEGWQDYHCGPLSYDGHKGTDFRTKDDVVMERGVNVLAAAEGTVRAIREGEEDQRVTPETRETIRNKECGNGVVTTHENGYEIQYCHLKKGSIRVKAGDTVTRGQVLAQIGLSGNTEFPHLDISVRKEGVPIDPFTGKTFNGVCANGKTPHVTEGGLWDAKTAALLTYHSTALLGQGFTSQIPEKQDIDKGVLDTDTLAANAPHLIFWAHLMGVRQGDVLLLSIITPDGQLLAQEQTPFRKNQAVYYQYIGKPYKNGIIPTGTYTGTIRLLRGSETVVNVRDSVKVE